MSLFESEPEPELLLARNTTNLIQVLTMEPSPILIVHRVIFVI